MPRALTRETLESTLEDHQLAICQVEDQMKHVLGQVDKKVQSGLQGSRGDALYRGIFAGEYEARDAGMFVLAVTSPSAEVRQLAAEHVRTMNYGQRDAGTIDSSTGAALVPIEFSNRIKRLVEEYGVFPRRAFNQPMLSDETVFLKQVGEVTVFLLTEGIEGEDSELGWERVKLQAKEWGTLCFYPRNLADDSAVDVAEQVFRSFAWAFSNKVDNIAFLGDGSAAYFGIQGIIPKLIKINGVDDGGGLVLGSGNVWSELTLVDHEKVQGRLPEYPGMEPRWYCSRAYYYNVMIKLMLEAGGTTATEIATASQKMFLGDPVEIVNVMPRVEGNSQVACLYGDMRYAATFGLRREMTMEASREYKFAERQVTCLGTMRPAISIEDLGDADAPGPLIGLITAAG